VKLVAGWLTDALCVPPQQITYKKVPELSLEGFQANDTL
jgi:hypothetical protein